jgi:phage-related protein
MPVADEIKPVRWLGDSLKQVQGFPDQVRRDIGVSLFEVQKGDTPSNTKLLKGMGSGVMEIVTRFDTNTYRTVYLVRFKAKVYVLHAFQKKSPKGIATAQQDIDLIKTRLKQAIELEQETKS